MCLPSVVNNMLLKLSVCPALQAGLYNGHAESLLGALMSKHVSLGISLTMKIETVKVWN